MLWDKVTSVVLPNFHPRREHPLVNKYLRTSIPITPNKHFEGILILRKNKKPVWVSHPFNYAQAKKILRGVLVENYQTSADLKRIFNRYCGKKIGFDERNTTVSSLRSLKKLTKPKWLAVSKELEKEREIKSAEEVKLIQKAAKHTRTAIAKAKKALMQGVSEQTVEEIITQEFKRLGCDTAFCIVAFGEHTSHIHHVSTHKKLKLEMPVLIDCGAEYRGYSADLTESFWFGKKIPKTYPTARGKVLQALELVEKEMHEGVKAHKLFALTKKMGKMPHALGHGIGLEVHDYPSGIGEKTKFTLKEGMVLAIEPAIYTKKFGIRIEHDYLIKKNHAQRL